MTITHRTTARQLGAILLLVRITPMTLTLPNVIGMPSSQGLWITGILGTVISLPLLAWMVALCRAEGLNDVVRISRRLLGTIIGSVVGWLFVLYLLILAGLQLRSASEAYLTGTMPETPIWAITALTALVSAGIARRGISLIAMMSELVAFLVLVLVLLTIVLPLDVMDLRNLLPLVPEGLRPLALPTGTVVSVFFDMAVLMMIAPTVISGRGLMQGTIWAALVAGTVLTLLIVAVTAVFGPISTALELPALSLSRIVSVGQVVERIELTMMASWTFGVGVALAVLLWAAAVASAHLLGLRCFEPLVYPLGGLAMFLGIRMWPDSGSFDRSVAAIRGGLVTSVFILVVLVILTAASWLRRRTSGDAGGRE